MLERVVSSFAGVGGFERSSCVPFDGDEPAECFRPKENAFPVDFRENFDVPFGTAGRGALVFLPLAVLSGALGSEDADETALRLEELSAVDTVFEFEVPLPLHSCQPLTGRMRGGYNEDRIGERNKGDGWLCRQDLYTPGKWVRLPQQPMPRWASPVYPKIKIKIAKHI